MEKANIRFYKVLKCGLYKPLARKATLGNFAAIIENVLNWSKADNKLIQSTCTYEVKNDFDMNFLETYLMSIKRGNQSGDYLLTTWNRTHEAGDAVYGLDPSTKTDSINANAFHKGNLPPTSIPGYATYFWLLPSIDTMATITFGLPRNGMEQFSYWLEQFINCESRYCCFDPNNINIIIGYAIGQNNPDSELEGRFKRVLHENPSKKGIILKNHKKIKKVIKRVRLDRSQVVHLGVIDNLSKLLGLKKHPEIASDVLPLTYEMSYAPDLEQINDIINTYENSSTTTGWEDVGFEFPENNSIGVNKIEWLSKSYAKTSVQLDIDWIIPGQLVDTDKLINTIGAKKEELINHLK